MSIKKVKVGFVALVVACTSVIAISSATTANAAPTGQWCKGVKIAAFPGGPQGGVFANNVYNGYRQAARDLGASVRYYFSDWDSAKMVTQWKEAIATKPHGIAMYGFMGPEAAKPLVDESFKKGIIVTTLNTSLTDLQAQYSTRGFGYVGAVNYKAGVDLAKEMVKRGKLKAGDSAFVWGLKGQGGDRGQRTVGVIDGFESSKIKVIYQEIDQATNTTPASGGPTFAGIMARNPDVKAVVTDHGGLTATAATYMKAANKAAGSVYFGGFDVSPATTAAITSGFLNLVIDQQPFLQGYLPILQICLTKKYGFSGLDVNTAGGFVDATNVKTVAPLAKVEIR
jgi:simple sugar transport system substrate-binding protein